MKNKFFLYGVLVFFIAPLAADLKTVDAALLKQLQPLLKQASEPTKGYSEECEFPVFGELLKIQNRESAARFVAKLRWREKDDYFLFEHVQDVLDLVHRAKVFSNCHLFWYWYSLEQLAQPPVIAQEKKKQNVCNPQ